MACIRNAKEMLDILNKSLCSTLRWLKQHHRARAAHSYIANGNLIYYIQRERG